MDWLWKWKRMHVTSACECIINIILVYRTRHLPKIPLRHHIRLLFECVYVCVRMCVCVCENLWRARKLCATYAKSLPKDLQKNQKKNKFTCGDGHFALNVLFDKRAFQRAFGGPKSSVGYLKESAGVQGQVKAQLKH